MQNELWYNTIIYLYDKSHKVSQSVACIPRIIRAQHQTWHLNSHRLVVRFRIGHIPHTFVKERNDCPAKCCKYRDHRRNH